jgi:hydroxyacylglutathione hydrolase
MTTVTALKVLGTNFTYLHRCGAGRAFVVDPGDALAILRSLQQQGLTLAAILATHHHWDHIAGAAELQAKTRCELIGVGRTLVPAPDRVVSDGDTLMVGEVHMRAIATPGHTRDSVCYYVPPQDDTAGVLYTGDTLFVGGCGRLLEGDAETMWQSLRKLATLPADTLVYCGHDYTLENYEFAVTIDPANRRLQDRLAEIQKTLEYGGLTVPSTIAQERATNLFLQADHPHVQAVLGLSGADPARVFAELRSRKDLFG